MEVCYQLSKGPPTHDFLYFLWHAEQERKRLGKKTLQVRIVKGYRKKFPRDKIFYGPRTDWRINNLLFPLAWLVPTVTEVSVIDDGKQLIGYTPTNFPIVEPFLRSSIVARKAVQHFLSDKPNPVSISLRSYDYQRERNSRIEEWREVASWLKSKGYTPIVVEDTEYLLGGSPRDLGGISYTPASMSPDMRLALYELCHTNLLKSQGPVLLGLFARVDMFVWLPILPHLSICTNECYDRYALQPGTQWGPNKHVFHGEDFAESIIGVLEQQLSLKEAA